MSENRKAIRLRPIAAGLLLQLALAVLLLKLPGSQSLFGLFNRLILTLESATRAGTAFVFGYLGGGPAPFETGAAEGSRFVLAFQALPLVLVVSAVSSVLFYWRVLPLLVRAGSWALRRTMGIGGTEGIGSAANIFVGMVEAPLLIRPYLAGMSRSELFTVMTCGMATIAGTVMALYGSILGPVIPGAMGHLLTASIISAPAAITIAKTMVPETRPLTPGDLTTPEPADGTVDALTRGALQGVELLVNIAAMLVVLVAVVHLVNAALAWAPALQGRPITLERVLGWGMAPVAFLMGIPWSETAVSGSLLGTKTVLNELIAYIELSRLPESALGPRSRVILTYALCGFANPGSLGIMIGGLGTMAPGRRSEIVELGVRSVVAGTLATCMTGAVVGLIGG